MKFEILLQRAGKSYRIQVTRTRADEAYEEFEVRGGEKLAVFRCDRPQWTKQGKKQRMKWQLLSKNFVISGDIRMAAQYMAELQDRIEDYLEPRPTFQERRNKSEIRGPEI